MPNANELERQRQEEEMREMSGTLNRDAFAAHLLEQQIKEQEREAGAQEREIARLTEYIERAEARRKTAVERAASLRDTLSRLENPDGQR